MVENTDAPDIPDYNNEEDDILSEIEDKDQLYEAISEFYDDIRTKTDIPSNTITTVLKLKFYANRLSRYNKDNDLMDIDKIFNETLDDYYKLRISNNRQGRKEFFNAITNLIKTEDNKSFLDKIRRR
jgi:hypothetical protein